MNEKIDLEALLSAVGAEPDPEAEAEPDAGEFGRQLAGALHRAVLHLRSEGLLEVTDEKLDDLLADVTYAGLQARSGKQLMKRVVRTLVDSEDVEEVYGTDDMLFDKLRIFLDPDA